MVVLDVVDVTDMDDVVDSSVVACVDDLRANIGRIVSVVKGFGVVDDFGGAGTIFINSELPSAAASILILNELMGSGGSIMSNNDSVGSEGVGADR
jgi:hypothetical protein